MNVSMGSNALVRVVQGLQRSHTIPQPGPCPQTHRCCPHEHGCGGGLPLRQEPLQSETKEGDRAVFTAVEQHGCGLTSCFLACLTVPLCLHSYLPGSSAHQPGAPHAKSSCWRGRSRLLLYWCLCPFVTDWSLELSSSGSQGIKCRPDFIPVQQRFS